MTREYEPNFEGGERLNLEKAPTDRLLAALEIRQLSDGEIVRLRQIIERQERLKPERGRQEISKEISVGEFDTRIQSRLSEINQFLATVGREYKPPTVLQTNLAQILEIEPSSLEAELFPEQRALGLSLKRKQPGASEQWVFISGRFIYLPRPWTDIFDLRRGTNRRVEATIIPAIVEFAPPDQKELLKDYRKLEGPAIEGHPLSGRIYKLLRRGEVHQQYKNSN